MNKVTFYFILSITTLLLSSCSKNDNTVVVEPPIAYSVQYPIDIAMIETFLKTNYITVTNAPGQTNDQDVVFTKITDATTQPSIYSYLNATTYPKLLIRKVSIHDIVYDLYYLVLREGVGEYPCNSDGLLLSYKGEYLSTTTVSDVSSLTTTFFQEIKYPQQILDLSGIDLIQSGQDIIKGWKEILPQFKSGTHTSNDDGTISYNDFGAGIMFIPSGLGYYSSGSSAIPAYAPLIFSFKLYDIKRLDHDSDGIPDYFEDLDGDRYMPYIREIKKGDVIKDDTDGDGIPDFYDVDDDGDNYSTKLEIKNTATGLPYPFAQIPTCTSGKKNYLDASCHP